MQARPLTLHIRLTKACNADCSYCSSWQESPERRLSPDSLTKILDFVLDTGPSALGINPTHLTAQFIGGEIAMVPSAELDQHIAVIKDACAKRSISCVFGAQSNLIVSDRRAAVLYDQFEGRLGTSIDLTSNTRTIKGDADRYRLIWKSADNYLMKNRSVPGAVYVLEPDGYSDAEKHLMDSARVGRMLTLRPIFEGGIKSVQLNSARQFRESMERLFDRWFLKLPIIVEPFYQLCESRVSEVSGSSRLVSTACAFQNDCTTKSLNIDPNGDLHVCLEMADAGLTPIGNGLQGTWDDQSIAMFSSRSQHLNATCKACPYLNSCQGGCMYESIAQGQGVHGKSFHCETWKSLFRRIDEAISEHGAEHVHDWLHRLATRHENAKHNGLARAALAHE